MLPARRTKNSKSVRRFPNVSNRYPRDIYEKPLPGLSLANIPCFLAEREVKRANRDLMQQVSKMDDMQKIDHLTKKSSELLADMRRLDKENQKNKKRGDTLQKERDSSRSELSKAIGLKEKLEKLCRELQRDNNKMKVSRIANSRHSGRPVTLTRRRSRTKIKNSISRRIGTALHGTRSMRRFCRNWKAISGRKTRRGSRW